jgi:hypothetical protein
MRLLYYRLSITRAELRWLCIAISCSERFPAAFVHLLRLHVALSRGICFSTYLREGSFTPLRSHSSRPYPTFTDNYRAMTSDSVIIQTFNRLKLLDQPHAELSSQISSFVQSLVDWIPSSADIESAFEIMEWLNDRVCHLVIPYVERLTSFLTRYWTFS